MEYKFAGFGLALLGVLVILLGNTRFGSPDEGQQGKFLMPIWLDHLIKWTIGGLCLWFGGYLMLSKGHIL